MNTFLVAALLAHIKLTAPESFQVADFTGSPQKLEPCGGEGEATYAVTTVEAGSQLTVSWKETIYHPGHFRLSIAQRADEFSTPEAVLDRGGNNCASAPIESNPAYPTLVDGLFTHTSAGSGEWSTTVTVPDMSCDRCVLQLLQFMSEHAPPCYYYQCAHLKIVPPDSGEELGVHYVGGEPPKGCGCSGGGLPLVALALWLSSRPSRARPRAS